MLGEAESSASVCVCVCVCVCVGLGPGEPGGSSGVSSIHVQSRDPGQRIISGLEWLFQALPDFSGMLHT